MSEVLERNEIMEELRAIRKDVDYIKSHVSELFLSPEDEADLVEAQKAHTEGKTKSLDELDKEMGI